MDWRVRWWEVQIGLQVDTPGWIGEWRGGRCKSVYKGIHGDRLESDVVGGANRSTGGYTGMDWGVLCRNLVCRGICGNGLESDVVGGSNRYAGGFLGMNRRVTR